MNPQELQQAQNEFGDSKAALAFSNMLREQQFMTDNPPMMEEGGEMMGEMPVEAPVEPNPAPTEEVVPETEETAPEEEKEPDVPELLKEMEERLIKKIEEKK